MKNPIKPFACLLALAAFFLGSGLRAQEISSSYYLPPVKIPISLSANCFELRPGHFHGGIDIKTQQVIGKPLYAVAAGYVSRVAVSPGGYGKALYISHPNGTTSVYGHVESFYDALERHVYAQQYARKSFSVDLYFKPDQFPVTADQLVALSGNRGSSGGPHLHFEIRDASGTPVNLLTGGYLNVADTIPPQLLTLYYIQLDTVQGIPQHRITHRIPLRSTSQGRYALPTGAPLEVARAGYFALEAKEFKNGTSNVMGVYRIEERLDGQALFGLRIDRIPFDQTRYVNALMLYGEHEKRTATYRLFMLPNNPLSIYRHPRQGLGGIHLADTLPHGVEIDLEDEAGNRSSLSLEIVRRDRFDSLLTAPVGMPVLWWKDFQYGDQGLHVEIPARALYESIFFDAPARDIPTPSYAYSLLYDVHTPDEPLQKAITLSLAADSLPEALRPKALLGVVSPAGKRSAAGGRWKPGGEGGRVEARVRNFGTYYIAVDTTAPRISPEFKGGEDFSTRESLSLKITDNFSGIDTYTATIDGEWALLEYDPKNDRITHPFDDKKWPRGKQHTLKVTVTDEKGNRSSISTTYKR